MKLKIVGCGLGTGAKRIWFGLVVRLGEGVVRFEVVVWVVDSLLVDEGLIVGGRLWSGDTDLIEFWGHGFD